MPYKDRKLYLTASDCSLERPSKFPGLYNKDNKDGTMMSKDEWIKGEIKKWANNLKQSEKYETTPFSERCVCLKNWLQKTFPKTSRVFMKETLMDIEKEMADETDKEQTDDSQDVNNDAVEMIPVDSLEIEDAMDIETREENDDLDMFADSENEEETQNHNIKVRQQEKTIQEYLKWSDSDLVENEAELPDCVKKCERYQNRKKKFIQEYIDSKFDPDLCSSQDILEKMTQLPPYVRDDKLLQDRLKHLTREEKSSKRCLKNLAETLAELRKDTSVHAFDQRVALVASVTDHRYGCPNIGETRKCIRAAAKLKRDFNSGKEKSLITPKRRKPQYPPEVFAIAENSWMTRSTKPDPAKHARPQTSIKDGEETVPTIWQVVTDDEAYEQFKENEIESVRQVMKKNCEKVREKYRNMENSETKRKTMENLDKRENLFPSRTWFLAQKPPQTKLLDDFSTALCKECNEALLNFETLAKYCRKFCKCQTSKCPNWVCGCTADDIENCECEDVCNCDDCKTCQVRKP